MDKKEIKEYIRTIIISLLIALFLAGVATGCSKIIAEHHAKIISKMFNSLKNTETINRLIEIYSEKAKDNPGDYVINTRLGTLYGLLGDYEKAEKQYNNAISKAPYGVYSPYFGLADVYIKQKRYTDAAIIVKKLDNKNYKPLLIAKGDFYMTLGDALWQDKKYHRSLKQYQIAFFFYKGVNEKKKEMAVNGIMDCYNKITNDYFLANDTEKAAESLETALIYRETPTIFYKLALLYKDTNPIKANTYMEKTFKTDPALINYDIYEEILIKLINLYYRNGQDIEKDLYMQKLKSLRNFQKRYVITENDIKINVEKLKFKQNLFKTKYKLDMKYNIENASKYDFNTLYLEIYLRYDDKTKKLDTKKLYSKKAPLKSRTSSNTYELKFNYTDKDKMYGAEKLYLEFYASKKENMRKIPVYSLKIEPN